jgi:hypothetical protein
MKTALRLAGLLALCAGSTACFAVDMLVKVKGDGSGTVEKTVTVNPMMLGELAQAKGGTVKDPSKMTDQELLAGPFDPAELKKEAARMGEGVTLVSATPVREKDRLGVHAVFAFKDINVIKLNQKPMADAGGAAKSSPSDDLRFNLTKQGGHSVLKVMSKGLELKSSGPKPVGTPAAGMDQMAKGMLEMMKPMLKGLRVTIGIEVDGTLLKADSPYVAGNRVTYLDLDFGALLADEKALQALGDQMDAPLEQQKAALAKVKGMKVHLEPEMVIEFQPR